MSVAAELDALADAEIARIRDSLPADPQARSALLTEATRTIDYWTVIRPLLPDDRNPPQPTYDLLQWGWNLAARLLFSKLDVAGAFPMMESTSDSQQYALSLLHQLGCCSLLRRAAEMIRAGSVVAETNSRGYVLRGKDESIRSQFLDTLEIRRLEALEERLGVSGQDNSGQRVQREEIDALMTELAHPWDSGRGIMVGYGAAPEVDDHFMRKSLELLTEWRAEAGIHPRTQFGEVPAADILSVAAVVIGLHLKHVRFVLMASQRFPEISLLQSLTIWGPRGALEQAIVDWTGMEPAIVALALDALVFRPSDVPLLERHTTVFRPLLIDLGNDLLLRPVSSIAQNPLHTFRAIQEWRDPQSRNRISAPREEWMRSDIYALFLGNRYVRVEGNVKVRRNGRIQTDIDGALFDRLTGELALFQIKWQDFFTNDVRELRSKAKNFAQSMTAWAITVEEWLERLDKQKLVQALRLRLGGSETIREIYLFGVSRTSARFQGYGINTAHPGLALASWPQFLRVRLEVGPAEQVFSRMHDEFRREAEALVNTNPIPVSLEIGGREIVLEDNWHAIEWSD